LIFPIWFRISSLISLKLALAEDGLAMMINLEPVPLTRGVRIALIRRFSRLRLTAEPKTFLPTSTETAFPPCLDGPVFIIRFPFKRTISSCPFVFDDGERFSPRVFGYASKNREYGSVSFSLADTFSS